MFFQRIRVINVTCCSADKLESGKNIARQGKSGGKNGPSGRPITYVKPCQVGSVGSISASHMVGREFASRPGHTKSHHKNGTNCLPAWHAMR